MDNDVRQVLFNGTIVRFNKEHMQTKIPPEYSHHQNNIPAPTNPEVMSKSLSNDIAVSSTSHQEAYFLFFVGILGIALNILIIVMILVRANLRRLTSSFLIHQAILNMIKAIYCIPFGLHLLHQVPPTETWCNLEGSSYVIFITTYAFNMLAMTCSEAFTFGEANVGGNARGTVFCVIFGVFVIYSSSVILHLGPTLIGGYFSFHPDIGNCMFSLGSVTSYIAYVMWISIVTLTLIGQLHFLCKLYKEIQMHRPNRVSMLVRRSITISDAEALSACRVQTMVNVSQHRAKLFILSTASFVICWYPLFLLYLIDINFNVNPKVYQTFSFIAWSHGALDPLLLVLFDRHINLLARYIHCDRYRDSQFERVTYLMSQRRRNENEMNEMITMNHEIVGSLNRRQYYEDHDADEEDLSPSPGQSNTSNVDTIPDADADEPVSASELQYSSMRQTRRQTSRTTSPKQVKHARIVVP